MATMVRRSGTETEACSPDDGPRFMLRAGAPTGDWRLDVERPPLGSLVAMLFRALVDRLQVKITELGGPPMKPSHLYILRSLHPTGVPQKELAKRFDVSKQAITQLIDGLEALGLVRRTPDPHDGRGKIVALTKRGEDALSVAVRAWGEVEREWTELLGGEPQMEAVREGIFAFIESYADWRPGEPPKLRPVW